MKSLVETLEEFTKKVIKVNSDIYNIEVFNQIITLNTNGKFEDLLSKLQLLIKFLNIGEDEKYRFEDLELREKRLVKLGKKINEVTEKVLKVMDNLLGDLQERNNNISKI